MIYLFIYLQKLIIDFDEAENNTPIHGGTSFFLSRLPSEIGTFLALIGGGLENDELHTLGIVGKRLDYSDRFKMSSFASKLETSKDFYTIGKNHFLYFFLCVIQLKFCCNRLK